MRDRRNINIAYFVGTNRTRFLQIRLGYLRGLIVVAVLLVGWSLLSCYLLYDFWNGSKKLSVALQESRATIFDYQSRYDGIYETAYGVAEPSLDTAKVVDNTVVDLDNDDYQPTRAEPVPLPVRKILPIPELISTSKHWQVAVQRPLFNVDGTGFSLQFRLVNTTKTGKRLSGHVWAQAKLRTAGDQQLTLVAPQDLIVDDKGKPRDLAKARPYRIRRRKLETLTFNLPKGEAGEIEELTVIMVDRTNRASYTFPLGIKFVTVPANISISKKVSKENF